MKVKQNVSQFIEKIKNTPEVISFSEVMLIISENYQYTPTAFSNGLLINKAGTNEGSCKIFSFAQLHNLNKAQTLACFGDYYRIDVLENPNRDDHANIRHFMISGWSGINYESIPLSI